ncbi:hypothetical protein [Endozoicomonas sp. ALB091]|uniref:hypothetical protein n=1 Tax=Endozoicomonas sp. ALB091 TaxID=3403073 RepID=UPI003BB519F7
MPIYKFKGSATVSCWTEVEAETEEEARLIAEKRELGSLNAFSISGDVSKVWQFTDDGMPQDIELDDD